MHSLPPTLRLIGGSPLPADKVPREYRFAPPALFLLLNEAVRCESYEPFAARTEVEILQKSDVFWAVPVDGPLTVTGVRGLVLDGCDEAGQVVTVLVTERRWTWPP